MLSKLHSKQLTSIIILFILAINLIPRGVGAVASETSECIINDACFYSQSASKDSICDPTLGGAAGSGPLYGPHFPKVSDTKQLASRILDFINKTQPKSVFNNQTQADILVSLGIKYDVNPALAIAQSISETSLGTTGHAVDGKNNVFNIRGDGSFKSFSSLAEGNEAYFSLIKRRYLGPPYNMTSISQIINTYAPPTDGNDTQKYIRDVNDVMHKILSGLGSAADDTSNNPAGAQAATDTVTSGCNISSAGELGWNITGNNKMVSYDQTDPKYSNHPYGTGKSSIGESGCGPTSIAMVVSTLSGKTSINPITIADKYGDKYHGQGGTSWDIFPAVAKDYNLNMVNLGKDLNKVPAIIKSGGLVIISVGTGYFTPTSHLMVIRAVTKDGTGFYINDPNGDGWGLHQTETKPFDAKFLNGEGALKNLWAFTRPTKD